MMNRSEENQNGCREQTRNEDEGIDGILEELMAYVCDELCRFREEMQGDLMDRICGRCGLQQYTDRIREEYEKINNFDKSQTGQLNYRLRQIAQRAFEREHGSREQFMKIFGENCLEEDEKKDVYE